MLGPYHTTTSRIIGGGHSLTRDPLLRVTLFRLFKDMHLTKVTDTGPSSYGGGGTFE